MPGPSSLRAGISGAFLPSFASVGDACGIAMMTIDAETVQALKLECIEFTIVLTETDFQVITSLTPASGDHLTKAGFTQQRNGVEPFERAQVHAHP